MIKERHLTRLIVAALVLLAFAWRILGLTWQSLWRDEVDTIFFALNDWPALLSMFVEPGQNGAFYFLLLRPWLRLVGSSEFALRYPSVIFGVLSLPLLWQVTRRLLPASPSSSVTAVTDKQHHQSWPRQARALPDTIFGSAALLAAIFLAVNPYQLWYSQEGRMYAITTFLVLLATWFWLDGLTRGGWRPWVGYLLSVLLAMMAHRLAILLVPLGFLWFILAWPQSKQHWRGYTAAFTALTVPLLAVAWRFRDGLLAPAQWTGLDFIPFSQAVESILLYQTQGILAEANMISLLPIFLLLLVGSLAGCSTIHTQPRDALPAMRRLLLILSWLLFPIFALYMVSLRQPLFLPRYLIWTAPAAMMLIALGIQLFWQRESQFSRSLAAALALYVVIFWITVGWQAKTGDIKSDLRTAVAYVDQRRNPDELLILQIPHLELAYRYYTGDQGPSPFAGGAERLGWWAPGPWTDSGLNDEQAWRSVDEEMRELTGSPETFWIITSEAETRDSRQFMDRWLEQNASLIDENNFTGVRVSAYGQ